MIDPALHYLAGGAFIIQRATRDTPHCGAMRTAPSLLPKPAAPVALRFLAAVAILLSPPLLRNVACSLRKTVSAPSGMQVEFTQIDMLWNAKLFFDAFG